MFDKGMNTWMNTWMNAWTGTHRYPAGLMRRVSMIALLACAMVSLPAYAQVELQTAVSKVLIEQDESGKPVRRLVGAENVVPGDTLQYVISFSNKGTTVVDAGSIIITNPLPPDTVYVEGSAQGAGTQISYSVDSGATFGQPADLKVIRDDVEVAAQAADYTTIRWAFKHALEAGKTGDVMFSVRLK